MHVRALRPSFIALAGLVLALPAIVGAQSFGIGSGDPFSLSVNPQNPAPYGQVTLSAVSASLNLANATMTVSVGGKEIYRGNVQPVKVTLGGTGVLTSVTVAISVNGATYRKTLSLRPQDVVLVAEPISSAPVLYPGKPLVPLEGTVRVVAMANLKGANGKTLDPNALSYAWTVDGAQIANVSGIGKEAIVVASPLQYRDRTVSVTVESQDGNLVGGASLSLTAQAPTLRLYENDPLLGILYDHALSGGYTVTGAETSLYAAPFSFPSVNGAPALQWFLNGAPAQTGNSITLRPTGSGEGSASLSLVASSGDFVNATANLPLSFGAKSGGNLFGL